MGIDRRTDRIRRRPAALAIALGALLLAGCSSSTSSSSSTTTIPHRDGVYAERYCEVLLVVPGSAGGASATVYNSYPMTDCPASRWSALDGPSLARENGVPLAMLNGPRYWAMDSIAKVREGKKVTKTFGGIPMDEEATVNVGDIVTARSPYRAHEVDRKAAFTFKAGRRVFELTAPDGATYVMQSWSQQVDPTLSAADLEGLASKLSLPAGWSYSSRVLEAPLVVQTTGTVAHVLMDDLQDSYSLEAAG